MRYPFLYSVIGKISLEELSKDIHPAGRISMLYDEWYLKPFTSGYLDNFVKENFHGMILDDETYFMSVAKVSRFHLDKRHKNYLTHRILIPLDTHFQYQWFVNDQLFSYRPKSGEVLLFNNLIPHRFLMDEGRTDERSVIYFNVADPNSAQFFQHFEGKHAEENYVIHSGIINKLGLKDD